MFKRFRFVRTKWATCVCLAAVSSPGYSAVPEPTAKDGQVARIVSALVEKRHVSRRPLDDDLSQRALNLYVESLDPSKLYFMQSDIDQFQKHATELDNLSKNGDVSPAFTIYERLLERIDQRVKVAEDLLSGSFDFTIDEQAVVDGDKAVYAASAQQARERWRREIKLQLLILKAAKEREQAAAEAADGDAISDIEDVAANDDDPKQQLIRRYRRVQSRAKRLDGDKLLERYLSAITSAYDPHTTYMSPGTMEQFMIMMRLNLEGIGAELREEDDYTVITKLIDGGAAARSETLAVGDKLLAVAQGDDGDWFSVVGMSVEDVASMIRGKSGSTVRLKIKSVTGDEKEASLKRTRVELSDKGATGRVVTHVTDAEESLKVGYIFLPSFYRDAEAIRRGDKNYRSSTRDVRKLIEEFSQQDAEAIVLDLRGNGGGFLDEAINVTGLFIDHGPVVQVKDSRGEVEVFRDEEAGVAWSGPVAVLTSKFSASASEIVAGAIKQYQRGLIVGDPTTHGKGTVQSPLDVAAEVMGNHRSRPNFGALKVTVQKYYLPDGNSTQVKGIEADVVLPSVMALLATDESELKHALPHDKIDAVRHDDYSQVNAGLLEQLRRASSLRIDASDDFADLIRRRDAYRKRKEQSHLSIKESTFAMEQAKLLDPDAASSDPKEAGEDFPVDHYEREVMEVVQDYVDALAVQTAR